MILDLQKASTWKRISAFLFDGIMLGIVAVLLMWVLSLCLGYDTYSDIVDAAYAHYGQVYDTDLNMSLTEYENLSPEGAQKIDEAYKALSKDEEALYAYNMMIYLTLIIISIGILLAFIFMEFLVPLLFGNGQTLGKKVFGICLMGTDSVKVKPVQLFIRTVLGKYAVETMVPVLIIMMIFFGNIGIMGPIILLALGVLEVIVFASSRTHALIHDLPAATVAVDMASQMIFDTKEDLIAYKEKMHAEKVARQPY